MSAFVQFYWQFGDGETSFEEEPVHRYNMPGDYTGLLTATRESGLKLKSTFSVRATDWSDAANGLNVSHTNTCFKFALKPQQGINISECTGSSFVFPEGRAGCIKIKDTIGQFKQLVLDASELLWYHVSTRIGASGSGLTKIWKDKEGVDISVSDIILSGSDPVLIHVSINHDLITGQTVKFSNVTGTTELNGNLHVVTVTGDLTFTLDGTESTNFSSYTGGGTFTKQGIAITPSFKRGEDRGEHEHFLIGDEETHLYVRPENEANRDADGYDSNGFPDGLEFTVKGYKDGNTTAAVTMTAVPKTTEIIANIKMLANRLQYEVLANLAEVVISGIQHYFKITDNTGDPDNVSYDELDNDTALQADLVVWISRNNSYLKNLAAGTTLAGAASQITGPDSKTKSAITISSPVSLANAAVTGTLMLWHKSGYTISGVSLTQYNTIGSWILSYVSGSIAANRVLPAGDVFDVRLYSATKSAALIAHYYGDVQNNSGDNVMGIW